MPEPEPRWAPPEAPENLTHGGVANQFFDADGNEYRLQRMDRWQAEGQLASNEVAKRAGITDMPDGFIYDKDGVQGVLTRAVPNGRNAFGGGAGFDPLLASDADRQLMMQHRVLDHALGSGDAAKSAWTRSGYANQGAGIHFTGGKTPMKYGKQLDSFASFEEPTYHAVERAYAKGAWYDDHTYKMFSTAKTSTTGKTMRAIQAIPDDEYRTLFRGFAEGAAGGPGPKADRLLAQLVDRKNGITEDFDAHFRQLTNERKRNTKHLRAGAQQKPLPGGAGGPKGMAGATPSEATASFMKDADHPITKGSRTAGSADARTYTSGAYRDINGAMRQGRAHSNTAGVRTALKPVKTDMEVYRGANMKNYVPGGDMTQLQGSVIHDRGFMSTSAGKSQGPAFGGDTGFIIRVNEGTPGAYVQDISHYRSEREFVIADNQPMYVHTVRAPDPSRNPWERNYRYIVEMETVTPEWAASAPTKVWDMTNKTWLDAVPPPAG